MTRTVWKFHFPLDDIITMMMPADAEILHIDTQYEVPTMWVRLSPDAPLAARTFRVAGTGHPLGPEVGRHLGSLQMHNGQLVWHVFEVTA